MAGVTGAGVGLVLRGRRLAIGVDVRRGVRRGALAGEPAPVERMTTSAGDDHERYVRGRVLALVYF